MRITNSKEEVSYKDIQLFFKNRITKYQKDNPYSLTMYQDNNPDLVRARNEQETAVLLPKLQLDEKSKVLDIACGIGRWSDAINVDINEYCGIDFCEDFISLAKKRNVDKKNRCFYVSRSEELAESLRDNGEGPFNRVLIVGCFLYLNDDDVIRTLDSIDKVCERNSIVIVREPIGLKDRLTLKEQYSEELDDQYNAIYRTRDELLDYFMNTIMKKGFVLHEEGFLFENQTLNNRKETSQYFFVMRR